MGAAYEAAGIVAAWQCPEYLKQRFRNTSMEYPGVRFDVEANDNALLATTSMTKEISGLPIPSRMPSTAPASALYSLLTMRNTRAGMSRT